MSQDPAAVARAQVPGLMRMVKAVVQMHVRKHPSMADHRADLIQEGAIGLMMATRKWNPQLTPQFNFYAYWWVQTFVQKGAHAIMTGAVSGRRSMQKRKTVARHAERGAVSEFTGVSIDDPETPLQLAYEGREVEQAEAAADVKKLKQLLTDLHKKRAGRPRKQVQAEIEMEDFFTRYLDETVTLNDISKKRGVSRERIRQREMKVERTIEQFLKSARGVAW